MRRTVAALLLAGLTALGAAGQALADSTGYEGQPGNQSNGGGNAPGLHGHEGQPGNQGGH